MPYLEKFNSDDIHARSVIAGLLSYLNQEVFILNTWNKEDKEEEIVEIPFYYSFTGDERYLQDFFGRIWNNCAPGKEGNYDAIPRGVVKLDGSTIQTSDMTQRFIRGNFNRVIKKVEDGVIKGENLEAFNAYINSIPLQMEFSVEIHVDTMTDAFKIQQTLIEVFYSSKAFYTTYKGILVPCQVGFPEQVGIEKTFEFSYPNNEEVKLTFNLTVETYLPVIDEPNLGSNNAIKNVNKMNDWLNNVPKNSHEAVEDEGIYGKQITGNENAYYTGLSRRDLVKTRLGHNSYSEKEGDSSNHVNWTIDNRSYELSSIRKNSNRIQSFIFDGLVADSKGPIKIDLRSNLEEAHAGKDEVVLEWSTNDYVHKLDFYYYNKNAKGEIVNLTQFDRFVYASTKKYIWNVPSNLCKSGLVTNIAVNTSTGKGKDAKLSAIIDAGGDVIDVIIENQGNGYDDTAVLEIEELEEYSPAILVPVVKEGKIVDCIIRDRGNYAVETDESFSDNVIYIVAVSSAGNAKSNEVEIKIL